MQGLYAGKVVSIKDPEKRGRIKVTIAELLGEAISGWCEPCIPCCFEGGGDFCLPDMGDYVWVAFRDGDINKPVYLGGWWTKNNSPLGDNYTNIDSRRIINFGDMNIVMNANDNSITLMTSDGDNTCTLKVTPKGAFLNGSAL